MIEIKVKDTFQNVMFTAKLNDTWIHILTMRDLINPHIKNIKLVTPGTGNVGESMEYDVEYDGYYVTWETFSRIGDEMQ